MEIAKRTDLKKIMAALAARIAFLPSLAYNVIMEKLSLRSWYNHIDDNVILGALPFRSMSKKLVEEENIKGVVSLNEDYELRYLANTPEEWKELGVDSRRYTVTDMFEAPSQEILVDGVCFMEKIVGADGKVYVHCKAGRSRSATMVGCYLMKKYNLKPEEAISMMKSRRPHILLKPFKLEALETFYKNNVEKNT